MVAACESVVARQHRLDVAAGKMYSSGIACCRAGTIFGSDSEVVRCSGCCRRIPGYNKITG